MSTIGIGFDGGKTASTDTPLPVTAQGAARLTSAATIAINQSLSGAVDLGSATLAAIVMDTGWTAAGLSFAVSADNVTYQQLNNPLTGEYTVPSAAVVASVTIQLPLGDFMGFRYIKIRSGTAAAPVTQLAARALTLISAP